MKKTVLLLVLLLVSGVGAFVQSVKTRVAPGPQHVVTYVLSNEASFPVDWLGKPITRDNIMSFSKALTQCPMTAKERALYQSYQNSYQDEAYTEADYAKEEAVLEQALLTLATSRSVGIHVLLYCLEQEPYMPHYDELYCALDTYPEKYVEVPNFTNEGAGIQFIREYQVSGQRNRVYPQEYIETTQCSIAFLLLYMDQFLKEDILEIDENGPLPEDRLYYLFLHW
ncbi:hypothetical protein H6771_00590 [Candidatus Peribacteria bacterium]|nr:hypothetical protein [Candidatus Peribacteria bacterium]